MIDNKKQNFTIRQQVYLKKTILFIHKTERTKEQEKLWKKIGNMNWLVANCAINRKYEESNKFSIEKKKMKKMIDICA
jgi:hypothetical protein